MAAIDNGHLPLSLTPFTRTTNEGKDYYSLLSN